MKALPKGKKPNGKKKANGGVNIRQATSSLKLPKQSADMVRSVPAAMGAMKITGRPRAISGPNGDCRIIHREYLGDVSMAASFTSTKYPINPGLGQSFPWLSQVANRFESYRFRRLRYCFETSCSSTQTGAVLLVPDYDALDSAPVSKVQALSYRNSARAQAWLSFCQDSANEDLNKQKSYFVRQGSVPSGADTRLYDVGNLFLCVQGSDTNTVGEFWVEYDVDLMTPQNSNEYLSVNITSAGSVSKTSYFGTAPTSVGSLQFSASGNTLTFNQAYEGLLVILVQGTGLAAPTITGTASSQAASGLANAAGTSFIEFASVRAQPGQTLILDFSASTTVTSASSRLGQYTYANA